MRHTGNTDLALTAAGEEQARALGRWFAQMPPDEQPTVILCSPYLRARETARIVADVAGITVDKLSDVGAALAQSVKNQADGKTTVLEMMVTKELGDPFRRDALSRPVRHLDKYKDYR